MSDVTTEAALAAVPRHLNGEGTAMLAMLEACIQTVAEKSGASREAIVKLVDERLAEVAPRRVEVVTRDGIKLGEVEGHVRPEFDKIAARIAAGINVLLVGPAGCGKTHLCHQIAEALGLRFGFLSLTAGVSESHLVGRFAPTGENGRFEYVETEFIRCYRDGGLFLLDEVDAADPNVLLAINAALANGHMAIPNPAQPVIRRHKDFRIVCAANTWGHGASREYCGRNQLDASTLDRFAVGKFALDYDEGFERDAGDPTLAGWVHALRRKVREHKIRRVVSTRLVLDGSAVIAAGGTLDDVKASFLLDWSDDELARVGETRPAA